MSLRLIPFWPDAELTSARSIITDYKPDEPAAADEEETEDNSPVIDMTSLVQRPPARA